jgi:hypothetical protein
MFGYRGKAEAGAMLSLPIVRYTICLLVTVLLALWFIIKGAPKTSPISAQRFSRQRNCLEEAQLHVPSDDEISSLLRRGRPLPSIDPSSPILAHSNWEGVANASHAGEGQPKQLTPLVALQGKLWPQLLTHTLCAPCREQ